MVEVYLLYFLIIALCCKMCKICLRFCLLKTLESVYMHCELGKSLSCHFSSRHAYRVTKSQSHDSDFCLLLYGHLYENVPFFPMPTGLCKEIDKGKRLGKNTAFIVTTIMVPTLSNLSNTFPLLYLTEMQVCCPLFAVFS